MFAILILSKALQTMKCGRRMIQHLIGDLSSETQEQSEARTAVSDYRLERSEG